MDSWKNDRIASAVSGENPTVMAKMRSGFAVIGDSQFLPGYCVLLGYPRSASLNDLPVEARAQFLSDMTVIGDAILHVCKPLRVNYSILMNLDNFLHAHIEARYDWEPDAYKRGPSSLYPRELRYSDEYAFSEERHGAMKRALTDYILSHMQKEHPYETGLRPTGGNMNFGRFTSAEDGMEITIRKIEPKDYPEVLSLWNNEIGNRAVNAENIAPHYARMESDARYQTFVALLEGKVVGFITTVQSYAVGFEVGFLHITGLAVKGEMQNKGIGTRLLRHVEGDAGAKGISSILLNSGFQRTAAHAFYERNGYDKGSYCFSKKLPLP